MSLVGASIPRLGGQSGSIKIAAFSSTQLYLGWSTLILSFMRTGIVVIKGEKAFCKCHVLSVYRSLAVELVDYQPLLHSLHGTLHLVLNYTWRQVVYLHVIVVRQCMYTSALLNLGAGHTVAKGIDQCDLTIWLGGLVVDHMQISAWLQMNSIPFRIAWQYHEVYRQS